MTPSPHVRVLGHQVGAFAVFGLLGIVAAIGVSLVLTAARGGSLLVQLAVVTAALVGAGTLAALERALRGHSSLTFYHYGAVVVAAAAVVPSALGAPVRTHLDASALGLGALLACGRIGCLRVGCCFGRRARRGILYLDEHAELGFPGYLVGLPLQPVQVLESAAGLALVIAGSALVLGGAPAGTGLSVFATGYAAVRFGLEAFRGDAGRRWWLGLSEAQWTSWTITVVIAASVLDHVLPGPVWPHGAMAGVLTVAAFMQSAGVAHRARDPLDPRHVRELRALLPVLERDDGVTTVVTTSLGLRVSHGTAGAIEHWSLSGVSGRTALLVSRVVLYLRHPTGDAQTVTGTAGVVHLVIARR